MAPGDFIPNNRGVYWFRRWLRIRAAWWRLLTFLRLKPDYSGDNAPPVWGPEPLHVFDEYPVVNHETGKTVFICKRCGGGRKHKVHHATPTS